MSRRSDRAPLIPRWFLWAAVLMLLVPAATLLLNHSAVQGVILQRLKTDTGVEVTAARVHLFPRLTVEFWDLVVRDDRHGEALFQSRHGSLTVRWLPLFKKRLAIIGAVVEQPHVVIRRSAQGDWRLPLPMQSQPRQDPQGGFTWEWALPDLHISGGEIVLAEEGDEPPHEARITDVVVSMESDLFRTEADLWVTGHVGENGGLELSGSVTLAPASSAGRSPGEAPHVQFEGSARLSQIDPVSWFELFREPVPDVERPESIDIATRAVIQWSPAGYDARLSQLETRLGWVVLRGQGEMHGMSTEPPSYSITASSSPVGLETLLQRIPAGWIPPAMRSSFKEHEPAGTIELVSATVNGRWDHPSRADWKAVAKLSQGRALLGTERIVMQNLSGTIFVDRLRVEAMNLSGSIGDLTLSDGRILISHVDVAPSVDLQVTGTSKIEAMLPLVQAVGGTGASLAVLKDLKGVVQCTIQVAGPLAPEPRVRLVKATLSGRDLGGRLPEWNLAAEHLDAAVEVTPEFVELQHVRGRVGPIVFDIQGPVELGPAPRLDDVTVTFSSDGAALAAFLPEHLAIAAPVSLDGPVHATVRLSGSLQDLTWTGRMDLGEVDVLLPPVIAKRRGVMSSLEFDGRIVKDRRMSIRRLAVRLPSALVESHAEIRLKTKPRFEAHVTVEPTSLHGLADAVPVTPALTGVLRASLSIRGRDVDWRRWRTSGWIQLTQGALSVEGLRDPLRALSVRLLLDGRNAMIERLAFKVGDSDVRVRGTVEDWLSAPMPRLTLESSKLDLTRLLPAPGDADSGGPPAVEPIRQWTESARADVTLLIGQIHYHRLTLRALSAHLTAGGGKVELANLVGETPDGLLKGLIRMEGARGAAMELMGDIEVSGMPIHQLIAVIDPDADPVRGSLAIKGRLSATVGAGSSYTRTVRTLDPLVLRIDNGRVIHGTVLPKVLKILNLPALLKEKVDLDRDGIPFDRLSATVTAENGLLHAPDLVFDSPVVKVSGAGTLDMVADELDLALAVSPLGAYADLVEKVPLFGTLLAGDRPGLSTALFEVTGPRRDPDVRYLPIESIAKGLTGYPRLAIDVLMNTVTLPQKLLEP